MKRVGFISDDVDLHDPISKILHQFDGEEEVRVETINRLNPELPMINKIQSLIELCDVIVFFISKGSPNIYYEIGLAQGAKKNIILIANSYNLIPFDLSHQKCIIMDGSNFEKIGYEISQSIGRKSYNNSVSQPYESDDIYDSYFNEYAPERSYRDLYAFSGPKRAMLFEQWFAGLAKNVKQWEVIENEGRRSRDSFDFMLWNSANDPELGALGNPIPVELKALNSMNYNQLHLLAEKLKTQGLRSLILLTTAKNKRNAVSFANELKRDHGILIVALDRDDLIEIETPKDLYFSIKQQLLNIMYRGG